MKMIQHGEMEFLEELVNDASNSEKTKEDIYKLAEKHGLKPYQAENVWSFYRQNNQKMKICKGLPCKLRSSNSGNDKLTDFPDDEIEDVSCLGYCEHAPVAWSNGKYFQLDGNNTRELDVEVLSPDVRKMKNLDDFVKERGFSALLNAIAKSGGTNLVEFVKDINLKGFGGSGFPAYVKWGAVSSSADTEKFLLVNAHEGEPGTFKDRILMESNPYDLIEAAFIAALAVGASEVVIALKYEYDDAEKSLKDALRNSLDYLNGKLGQISLPAINIIRVPGYYITGEESALMEAIEGRRSEPRLRPPYPAEVGLFGKPTLIDNVETLLYFLARLRDFNKTGDKTAGDKSYCLTGDVKNPGSYRLPYGSPSTKLLEDKGGTNLNELKAILPGGLSGGILPAEKGNINLDFDSVKKAGAGMGTGAMIAVSKNRCMADVMDSVESFFERESCGKCMPCRYGTAELSGLFKKLKQGEATQEDINVARKTADVMLKGSICGLGQASAKMFLDSLVYFNEEMEDHTTGRCQANVCFQEGR